MIKSFYKKSKAMKTLGLNRRASFDYDLLEIFEAGLVLFGFEVKAVSAGKISLKGAYVSLREKELFLENSDIAPYQPKNTPPDYDQRRSRKLLLKKKEIIAIAGKLQGKGLTLVPLKVYNVGRKLKLKFALARGQRKTDKRTTIKEREFQREKQRFLKEL